MDKKQYWKNRKAGKRGQGEPVKPKILDFDEDDKHFAPPQHFLQVGMKLQRVNRATARKMGQNAHND